MEQKQKKKKFPWQQGVVFLLYLLLGGACGVLMMRYLDSTHPDGGTFSQLILSILVMCLALYAAMFVQIVIHEAGHLVFGLLSGYRFTSFRVFSLMWIKEDGRLRLKRFSVAGTGGQCLMAPPDLVDGKIPVALYNLGGSLMNVIAGAVFLGLYFVTRGLPLVSLVSLMLALVGFVFALVNGIPMRMGTVDNDGYNAFSLGRDPDALRAFWVQMKVNDQISKGLRVKDMPGEWFTLPSDEGMKNSMIAAVGVFACNRLMDQHDFKAADEQMARLLALDSGMVGLHRSLLICDRIYCELIEENRREIVEELLTKEQKKFMKSMKTFCSVLRTQYALALLAEGDVAKAGEIKARFEKLAKSHPYPNDIQLERELMVLAEEKYHAAHSVSQG